MLSSLTPLFSAPPPSTLIGIICKISVGFLTALLILDEEMGFQTSYRNHAGVDSALQHGGWIELR